MHYPKYLYEQKASVSYGITKNIEEYNIYHLCSTEYGSSGSPIINLSNNKVVGIHKENILNKNVNRGTFLKFPINEYLNQFKKINNEIQITLKIEENEIVKNIYFLNYDKDKFMLEHYNKDYRDSIEYFSKLLNESKIKILINNKKYENKRYFKPEKAGIYIINLIFKEIINTCQYRFTNC